MQKSEALDKLAAALVRVQAELRPIEKNAENPAFKRAGKATRYVDLTALCEAVFPLLAKNGLAVAQGGDGPLLETMLIHESGQWISTALPLHIGTKPQEMASSITYARRYALAAIVGAAPEGEDDDGNAASQTQHTEPPSPIHPFIADYDFEFDRIGPKAVSRVRQKIGIPEAATVTELLTVLDKEQKRALIAALRAEPPF